MKCPHCGRQISPKDIARAIGSYKSDAKADAARENGRKGGRPKKQPIKLADSLSLTLDELREFTLEQRAFYANLKDPAVDFPDWLAYKLSCSRSVALQVEQWAQAH